MAIDLSCRLVFLASPGGLSTERSRVRAAVRRYNETRALEDKAVFYIHAWEDLSGGVGRPQDLINPSLDECDFVLLLFGDWWGSPPAAEGPYTSGTEEEFYRALDMLARDDRPMRDMLVLFKALSPERLRDPGESLKAVLHFRARLEASKSLMYESFDSLDSLERIVERKLRDWSKPLGPRQPRLVSLPAVDLETGSVAPDRKQELLEAARAHAAAGMLMQAEAAFARATSDRDPGALLEYAQFMRRSGRLQRALELNRAVIDDHDLLVAQTSAAVASRVNALANIGVIQRKLGNLTESAAALREAVATAKRAPEPVLEQQCYALDNYGLTLIRAGNPGAALQQFKEADDLRRDFGTREQRAQSAINLGRQHLSLLQLPESSEYFVSALRLLEGSTDDHLLANAYAGLAESLLRQDRDGEAGPGLKKALELNERIQNVDGRSIVHALIARSLLKRKVFEEADLHIREAAELVSQTGNAVGEAVILWLKCESARLQGKVQEAKTLLLLAEQAAAQHSNLPLQADVAQTSGSLKLIESTVDSAKGSR